MHPAIEISVGGAKVSSAFYSYITSVTVTDKDGIEADSFQLELNDGSPNFISLPTPGDYVTIAMGYRETGVRKLGDFEIDKVSGKCLPYSVSVTGKSAKLGRHTVAKEPKERHWDKKKVKDIVDEIAGELGLRSRVDNEIGQYEYEWLGQQDESDIHLLRRLERRHNGLFTVKQGQLLFTKRGSGLSSGGAGLGTVIITPAMILQGTCTYEVGDRSNYKKVVSYYQDKDKVKRVEIEHDVNPTGESVYRIPEPFASVAEADKAANAKSRELKRGEGATKVTVAGNSGILAGVGLVYAGVRPQLDGIPYVIDTATHTYSKSAGYRTEISAKVYDGESAGGGSGNAGNAGNASNAGGVSTPTNAPIPTPSPLGEPSAPGAWGGRRTG